MFFIMGISEKTKQLNFYQTEVCLQCGQYGRWEVFMVYTFFSLFFIPIFKWNKRFFVKTSCCKTIYSINKDLGNRILKGEQVTLQKEDLHLKDSFKKQTWKKCSYCGYTTEASFNFCPKCGNRL